MDKLVEVIIGLLLATILNAAIIGTCVYIIALLFGVSFILAAGFWKTIFLVGCFVTLLRITF